MGFAGIEGVPRPGAAEVERLARLVAGCRQLEDIQDPARRETLLEEVQGLAVELGRGPALLGRPQPVGELPLDIREAFFTAVLSLPLLAAMPGPGRVGNLVSGTMEHYRADDLGEPLSPGRIAGALELPEESRARGMEYVEESADRLDRIHRVMEAVLVDAGLGGEESPKTVSDEAALTLFRRLYPLCTLRPGEVKLYWTHCTAHFAVFVRETRGEEYACFWDSVGGFRFPYYDHFPMFGFLDTSMADHDWVTRIAELSGQPEGRTRRILDSSVMALKGETVELYLLHDIWGHRWQGPLTRWKRYYDRLKLQDESLVVTERTTRDGRSIPFSDLIQAEVEGGAVRLYYGSEALWQWLSSEVEERLALAFTQLLSEQTADLIEHKYETDRPPEAPCLGTTSHFPGLPCKPDFAVQDWHAIWQGVFRPFREISRKQRILRQSIREALWPVLRGRVTQGALESSLDDLVPRLVADIEAFHDDALDSDLQPAARGQPSFHACGLANLMHLQGAMTRRCAVEDRADTRLFRGSREVMCLFLAQLIEKDPGRNFWRLDEVLEGAFEPMLEAVKRSGDASGG